MIEMSRLQVVIKMDNGHKRLKHWTPSFDTFKKSSQHQNKQETKEEVTLNGVTGDSFMAFL